MKIGINLLPVEDLRGSNNIIYYYLKEVFSIDSDDIFFVFVKKGSKIEKWMDQLKSKLNNKKIIIVGVPVPKIKFSVFIIQQLVIPLFMFLKKVKKVFTPTQTLIFLVFKKNIFIVHDLAYIKYAKEENYPSTQILLFKNTLRWAKFFNIKILTPTNLVKKELVDDFNFKAENIFVLPWGIPIIDDYDLIINDYDLRDELFKFIKKPYFLYIGSSLYRKNIKRILLAFKKFFEDYPSYYLVLAGYDFSKNMYSQYKNDNLVNENVIFYDEL